MDIPITTKIPPKPPHSSPTSTFPDNLQPYTDTLTILHIAIALAYSWDSYYIYGKKITIKHDDFMKKKTLLFQLLVLVTAMMCSLGVKAQEA